MQYAHYNSVTKTHLCLDISLNFRDVQLIWLNCFMMLLYETRSSNTTKNTVCHCAVLACYSEFASVWSTSNSQSHTTLCLGYP